MLKFAYQGPPSPGEEKPSHTHPADGEDDSCCEVCHHRKRELSREKSRVNRARSRSRERTPRGYTSCSDTSTGFSEESRSRADTSSEDTSSLSCQHEERGRPGLRRDVTQSTEGQNVEKENLKENDPKQANVKRGFSLFKMFQKGRVKDKKVSRQCPVCGNEESESCCISNGNGDEQNRYEANTRKQRQPKSKARKQKIDNEDFINAWRNNDGSMSSCELYCNGRAFEHTSRNRCYNNRNLSFESDSECIVRHRKIQRTKSGGELCMLDRNSDDNPNSLKRRLMSRSCERLSTTAAMVNHRQETKNDVGRQFARDLPVVDQPRTSEKLQGRYRKKNRRSKSCEKLNSFNSPQKQSYRNYDSDWEIRSTIETIVVNQSDILTRNRRKARSCERLSEKQPEKEEELRQLERRAKRKNLEQTLLQGKEDSMFIRRTPSKPVVKEATVRKTKVVRSRERATEGEHYTKKSASLPRQRRMASNTDVPLSYECNFDQSRNYGDQNAARKAQTLGRGPASRTDQYCDFALGFNLCKDNETNRNYVQDTGATQRVPSSDDALCYSEQLRRVASSQRDKLFSAGHDHTFHHETTLPANHDVADHDSSLIRTRTGKTVDHSFTVNALRYREREPNSTAYGKFHQSNSGGKPVLETNIDEHSSLGRHKYTSLTSLSTTVSTTSEDSIDSGNGSLSDRIMKTDDNRNSYSPIDAERQRQLANTKRTRPCGQGRGSVHETSDYESEASSNDATFYGKPKGRRLLPQPDQNSNTQSKPSASTYRRPRIRYVEY